jgi:hypothetical protein
MPAASPPRAAVALAGLAVGLSVAAIVARRPGRSSAVALLGACGATLLVVGGIGGGGNAAGAVAGTRITLASPDQADAVRAALQVAATAAFAVHSGFDFVWHLPAVVLTVCLLAGLVLPMPRRRRAAHAALEAPGLAFHPMAWASTRGEHQEHATSSGGPVPRGSGGHLGCTTVAKNDRARQPLLRVESAGERVTREIILTFFSPGMPMLCARCLATSEEVPDPATAASSSPMPPRHPALEPRGS